MKKANKVEVPKDLSFEDRKANYKSRFRMALNLALQFGFMIKSVSDEGVYVIIDSTSDNTYHVFDALTKESPFRVTSDLEDFEYAIEFERKAREEATRRYNLRQQAVAKLTKEEREVLGLS